MLRILPAKHQNKIIDGIELAVRNAKIEECWTVLSNYTKFNQRQKLDILTSRFNLGEKSIENIIYSDLVFNADMSV